MEGPRPACFVVLATLTLSACSLPPDGGRTSDETETRAICQQAIGSHLEAPATARFPDVAETVFGPAAENRDITRILTYVDTQAAPGALRHYFQCDCELKDGRWVLRQLKEIKR
jgi:hypothetical protein